MEEAHPKQIRSNEPSSSSTSSKPDNYEGGGDGFIPSISTEPEGCAVSLRQAQTPKHCNKTSGVNIDTKAPRGSTPSRSRRSRSPTAYHGHGSPQMNQPKPPSSPAMGYHNNPDYYSRGGGGGGSNYYEHGPPAHNSYSNESYSNYYSNEPTRRGNDGSQYPYPPQLASSNGSSSYSNQNNHYGPPPRTNSYDPRDSRYYNSNAPHLRHESDSYGSSSRHGPPPAASYPPAGGYTGYNSYDAPSRTYSSGGVPPSNSWGAGPAHAQSFPPSDSRPASYDHGPPRRTYSTDHYTLPPSYEPPGTRKARTSEEFSRTVSNSFEQKPYLAPPAYPPVSPGAKDRQSASSPPVIPSASSDTSWHQLQNVASVEEPPGFDKKPKKKVRVNPEAIEERNVNEKERADERQHLVNTSSLDSLSDVASIADPINDQQAIPREAKSEIKSSELSSEKTRKRPPPEDTEQNDVRRASDAGVSEKQVNRELSNDEGSLNSNPNYPSRYQQGAELARCPSHQSNTSQTTMPNMGNLASWDFENKDSFVERAAAQGLLPSFSFSSNYNIPESYSMGATPPVGQEVVHQGDRRGPSIPPYPNDRESRNQSFDGYPGEGHHGEYRRGPPMGHNRGYGGPGPEVHQDSRGIQHGQYPPSYHSYNHRPDSPWGGVPGAPPAGPPPNSATYHPNYNPSYNTSHDSYHGHSRNGPPHNTGSYQHGPPPPHLPSHGHAPSHHHSSYGPPSHHGRGPSPPRVGGRYDDPQRRTSPPMPHHEDFMPPRNDYGMHHPNNPPPAVYIVPSNARGPIPRSNCYDPSMIAVNGQHMGHISNPFGWSPDDDAALSELMKKYKNPTDWDRISKEHGRGKSAKKCHERWIRYLKPGVRKGQWQDHEDAIVIEAVTTSEENPFTRWSELAQRLPGRVGKQIRDRWVNHLNPNINHMPFTREDDLLLFKGHQELGKRWVEISTKYFNNTRSENHIKNRWYSASFKKFITGEFGPDIDIFKNTEDNEHRNNGSNGTSTALSLEKHDDMDTGHREEHGSFGADEFEKSHSVAV